MFWWAFLGQAQRVGWCAMGQSLNPLCTHSANQGFPPRIGVCTLGFHQKHVGIYIILLWEWFVFDHTQKAKQRPREATLACHVPSSSPSNGMRNNKSPLSPVACGSIFSSRCPPLLLALVRPLSSMAIWGTAIMSVGRVSLVRERDWSGSSLIVNVPDSEILQIKHTLIIFSDGYFFWMFFFLPSLLLALFFFKSWNKFWSFMIVFFF